VDKKKNSNQLLGLPLRLRLNLFSCPGGKKKRAGTLAVKIKQRERRRPKATSGGIDLQWTMRHNQRQKTTTTDSSGKKKVNKDPVRRGGGRLTGGRWRQKSAHASRSAGRIPRDGQRHGTKESSKRSSSRRPGRTLLGQTVRKRKVYLLSTAKKEKGVVHPDRSGNWVQGEK